MRLAFVGIRCADAKCPIFKFLPPIVRHQNPFHTFLTIAVPARDIWTIIDPLRYISRQKEVERNIVGWAVKA
jgi:hypothetical protein